MTVIYLSEKQKIELVQHRFNMSKEEFAKKVLGYSDPKHYINYLDGKADLSIDSIRSLASYSHNINVGAILSNEEGDSIFIQSDMEFKRNRKNKQKIEALTKEIEYLKKALEDKEDIIFFMKNQKE